MSNKTVYLVPLRNDIAGLSLQIKDLSPNESTRSLINDPSAQAGYVPTGLVQPGTTIRDVSDASYVRGSVNTLTVSTLVVTDIDADTTDDSTVTPKVDFGLAAYLRERIDKGAAGVIFTPGQAATLAGQILTAVVANGAATAAIINAALVANTAGTGMALGDSNANVTDILRILSGEVYMTPKNTIIGDEASVFLSLADRVILAATGTGYSSTGRFLVDGDPGFKNEKAYVRTGSLNSSAAEGDLSVLKGTMTWNNPAFAYTAADVLSWKPRATTLAGVAIAADTAKAVLLVLDYLGAAI